MSTSPAAESRHGSLAVEPLVPSEDFVNLIAEDIAPECYGRPAELDTQDRMIWAEMQALERRMWIAATLRHALFRGLPLAAAFTLALIVLLHILERVL